MFGNHQGFYRSILPLPNICRRLRSLDICKASSFGTLHVTAHFKISASEGALSRNNTNSSIRRSKITHVYAGTLFILHLHAHT